MKKRALASLLLATVMGVSLIGCGSSSSTDTKDESTAASTAAESSTDDDGLKTIVTAETPDMPDVIAALKEPLAKLGYKMEENVYDDGLTPNQVLEEGSVDCNFYEHEPYLNTYLEETGADLVMLQPKAYSTPNVIVSDKIDSLDDVEDGMQVAIADVASNKQRCLLLLQEAGLITLADEPIDETYAVADIVDNPHNLDFVEVDQSSVYSLLPDVGFIVTASDVVAAQGGDPSAALYREKSTEYAVGVVVRAEDQDAEWAQALNEALHSDEFKEALEAAYPGVYEFVEE